MEKVADCGKDVEKPKVEFIEPWLEYDIKKKVSYKSASPRCDTCYFFEEYRSWVNCCNRYASVLGLLIIDAGGCCSQWQPKPKP